MENQMDVMVRLGTKLFSFLQTYPSRQIHWGSARSLHHKHIHRQEPSTPLQHCSAFEGVCRPVLYCGGHMSRSQELRPSALPLRESPGRTPSKGWWLDSAGRRLTLPWGKRKLHCQRWPGQIWNKMEDIQSPGSSGVGKTRASKFHAVKITRYVWVGQSYVSWCWYGCICWVDTGEVSWAPPWRNSYQLQWCRSSPSPPWSPSQWLTAALRKEQTMEGKIMNAQNKTNRNEENVWFTGRKEQKERKIMDLKIR